MNIFEPHAVFTKDYLLAGERVQKSVKHFANVIEIYEDKNAAERLKSSIAYEVYTFSNTSNPDTMGALQWGVSVLQPTLIGTECNMTRGHFHANPECEEVYFGLEGEGLLLLMDCMGKTTAEKVSKGSVHIISGDLGHRLVNTGESLLKVGACWSPAAGYRYDLVEKRGFAYRVYRENGEILCKEREL